MATATATKEPAKAPVKLVAIGPTIDKMNELRERKRVLEADVKKIQAEYDELEEKLFAKLDAEGTRTGAGKTATCSISESVVGNLTDDAKFFAYVKKTGYFHLLQRRLSAPAVRELFEKGVKIPGCEPFTERRLNLRAAV
jgi:hypothetical protein